jgi:poly(A) polymerase
MLDKEPVVIAADDHPIREQDIDREALKVLYRLRDAGFSGYLVGGGVRDVYLGKQPKDFDISTDARPGQLRKLFRNSRTIGRRFRLVQVFFRGNKIIEVSTLRSLSEFDLDGPDQVLPSNNTFGTLEEDAFRRDLTINSLFYEVGNHSIIDFVGGVADLNDGIIRIVGDPDRRITRDPVRMMRAIRHCARNDFQIEAESWKAIVRNREKLRLCPPARIRDELFKDLRGGCAAPWGRLALDSGLFYVIFPFYEELLAAGDKQSKERLLKALGVIDRLHTVGDEGERKVLVPDTLILAVLMLTWADKTFDLSGRTLKGGAYHQLSRCIRKELDERIGLQFKLNRMVKEEITGLLLHLITFRNFSAKGWPKWLEKRSYFTQSLRFFDLVAEVDGGPEVDPQRFVDQRERRRKQTKTNVLQVSSEKSSFKSRGRRGTNPAFSNRKSGVFGLRRH